MGRLGGDEFAVLLEGPGDAEETADKLLDAFTGGCALGLLRRKLVGGGADLDDCRRYLICGRLLLLRRENGLLEHRRAGVASDDRDREPGQGDRRQDPVLGSLPTTGREPA